ncbi:hypothetical protein AB7M45_007759 [Bradyrhizobium elkanii]|uniref:hypothetical protein n=1 Tax=Bradyrhizobium elkanii TaxID=29448 RepID=UPI00092332A8|nr:hypothetical protein [Bradyrhizobium elkanii]MCW2194986.1 hypothetical protein [Bradyrhizobium elkanii]NWL67314.1 hypothetical protein [Bradyrhizobium elkanii]OIM93820.1 hypothetical protein BLN97_14220 [Bradyrhizobium elkanii]
MDETAQLMSLLEAQAKSLRDGHLTILRFTANWRVGFGTPSERDDIAKAADGPTFAAAARKALANPTEHCLY